MTVKTTNRAAETIVPAVRLTIGLAQSMVADIPPDKFARKPEGVDTNHPAWALGHLSIYPDTVLEFIGRSDLADPDDRFGELFKAGSECCDDAAGSIYPGKDEIVARFTERMNTVADALEVVDEAALAKANDAVFPDKLPTVGAAANFLLGHHVMLHLGQISAWRRSMGLGPCTIG